MNPSSTGAKLALSRFFDENRVSFKNAAPNSAVPASPVTPSAWAAEDLCRSRIVVNRLSSATQTWAPFSGARTLMHSSNLRRFLLPAVLASPVVAFAQSSAAGPAAATPATQAQIQALQQAVQNAQSAG